MKLSWKALLPLAVLVLLLALPAPAGLAPHAWRFFAIFAAGNSRLISARFSDRT